ncbi:MAG: type II secretion system protein [Shimia sp.]|nr:type II secretion system protein [Shimia sp.]
MFAHRSNPARQRGFSYTETLIATVLIALALVPALEALQPGIQGSGIHQNQTENHYLLTTRLEEVLAQPFTDLEDAAQSAGGPNTPTDYSDSVNTTGGRTVNRQVYLSRYDGDNADADDAPFTGTDDGLLWVRVAIDDSEQAIETVIDSD